MDKHSSSHHSKLTSPDGCITSYHLRYSRYSRSVSWHLPILFAESRSNRQPCSCCLKDSKNLNLILFVSLKFFKFVVCPILLIASPFIFLCLFWHVPCTSLYIDALIYAAFLSDLPRNCDRGWNEVGHHRRTWFWRLRLRHKTQPMYHRECIGNLENDQPSLTVWPPNLVIWCFWCDFRKRVMTGDSRPFLSISHGLTQFPPLHLPIHMSWG